MSSSPTVGIFGSNGFVGSAVAESLRISQHDVSVLPRILLPTGIRPETMVSDLARDEEEVLRLNVGLLNALEGVDRIVNAAGLAAPADPDVEAQWRTNTLLPAVVDVLASAAGVQRLIHVSSAAVQADARSLDESDQRTALTAYARSKADAERYLEREARVPTIIYRATSVIGPGRAVVNSLKRFYRGRVAPVFGDGTAPMPLSALPNTAAAISHLAMANSEPGVALQPWEGVTQKALATALRAAHTRLVRVPVPPGSRKVRSLADSFPAPVLAQVRRLDLLVFGQEQNSKYLSQIDFQPPVNTVQYLAELD